MLLNLCEEGHEDLTAASAMRVANMANTFHKSHCIVPSSSGSSCSTSSSCCSAEKCYLQTDPRLRTHSIWRQPGFWESALKESVFAQLKKTSFPQWDDIEMDHIAEVAHS